MNGDPPPQDRSGGRGLAPGIYPNLLGALIRRELANSAQLRREAIDELARPDGNPRVLGSVMHDFYNCCERVFRRIDRVTRLGRRLEGVSRRFEQEIEAFLTSLGSAAG